MPRSSFSYERAFSSFSVDDLQGARAFYGATLGLDLVEDERGLGLRLAGGGEVFIYPKPDHAPATYTVLNFRVADVEAAVAALSAAGVRFEIYHEGDLETDERGIMAGGGMKIAWFRDPAGNFLSVIEED